MRIAPQPGPQTQFASTSADIALFGGSAGGGKCLSLDTAIPLASGEWTTMRDVAVGDVLLDNWGKPCNVTYVGPVMHGHKCYELSFHYGGSVVADAGHLWYTWTTAEIWSGQRRKQGILRTTQEIVDTFDADHRVCADVRPAGHWTGWNAIEHCTEVPSVPVRCITVDSPEHLYLVSEGYVPTHNTYWLNCEPLRHVNNERFNAVTFRRTYKQITEAGGMWDETMMLYPFFGAVPKMADLLWKFPRPPKDHRTHQDMGSDYSGATVRFRHLQHEQDKFVYQGAQICLLNFDQAEQFEGSMIWYLLQRNRSACGVRPYLRMTCNPDPDCFLAPLVDWWIGEDGYPIQDRGGVIRYFIRLGETITWGESPDELVEKYPHYFSDAQVDPRHMIKSFTFIPSTIHDNKILLDTNPEYLANLYMLPTVERERLLKGNWRIRPAAGDLFNRVWFPIVDAVPWGGVECRFWDLAASTKKGSDFTAGVKIRRIRDAYFVTDMIAVQAGPSDIDQLMFNTAIADNQSARESATGYAVRWEIEGGASGVRDDHRLREMLRAFDCGGIRPQGDKLVRAKPLAAASHQGNVRLLQGHWNEEWLTHMHHQPDWSHDDIMDASTGAYNALSATMTTTEEVVQMPWVSIGPQL